MILTTTKKKKTIGLTGDSAVAKASASTITNRATLHSRMQALE